MSNTNRNCTTMLRDGRKGRGVYDGSGGDPMWCRTDSKKSHGLIVCVCVCFFCFGAVRYVGDDRL